MRATVNSHTAAQGRPLPGLLPGLLAAAAAVVLALAVHTLVPVLPAMTLAVVFGLLAANFPGLSGWTAGRAGRAWISPAST